MTSFHAVRKKLSAGERRKRRAQKQVPIAVEPSQTSPVVRKLITSEQDEEKQLQADVTLKEAADESIAESTNPVQGKAEKLLEAQRQSVAMLTRVREAMEAIDTSSLDKGYMVVDDLLKDDATLDALAQEGVALLVEHGQMTADIDRLGSAEYICRLEGGQEQYSHCPRSIEWVVSCTKHFPAPDVDHTNTMAFMRTFDRKAYLASVELLTGSKSDENEALSSGSFGVVVEGPDDHRCLSMRYYTTPSGWTAQAGGGLTFESTGETVDAIRDRLVVWKSEETRVREEPWRGTNAFAVGSCLELHLLRQA